MISTGIKRIGGKSKLVNILLEHTPYHEGFLSLFTGSGIYEVNKPRASYEVLNDLDSELMNYFTIIQNNPLEFEQYKKGVFGLCSKYLFDQIRDKKILPRNDVERAYFFYYLVKISFAGLTKQYFGMNYKSRDCYRSQDNGLLTPLDPRLMKRLHRVYLLNQDFTRCHAIFKKFISKKGLREDVFMYCDPPYPGTENVFLNKFKKQVHYKLIEILSNTKFKFMLSIGGDCGAYLDQLSHLIIKEVKTVYSANARSQYERKEYLITNYDMNEVPRMVFGNNQHTINHFLGEVEKK